MAKLIELRRHADDDGDVLSDEGVEAAIRLGQQLAGGYQVGVSTGAQRATQTIACLLAGLGQPVPGGVVVETGLRSPAEDRWKEIARQADGSQLSAFRAVDAEFVVAEQDRLAAGLRAVFDRIDEGQRALVVGHSPTNEAAVAGLTGTDVQPLSKGEGVAVIAEGGGFRVASLP
ncbi:MAG: histidine phosphatase family protein [Euzebyales bacterium]|nr:histidine phosphatase family protein [Euzebyales bacterium]